MNSIGDGLFSCADSAFRTLQTQFQSDKLVVLPQFFPAPLLASIERQLESTSFVHSRYHVEHPGSTGLVDEMITDASWVHRIMLLLNEPKLIERLGELTQERELKRFSGRLYKLEQNSGQHLDWHSDFNFGKRIALSINLSPLPFDGGQLQLRNRTTGRLIEHQNQTMGDAVIFQIAENLEHRVLPVTGDVAKQTLTGWFFC